MSTVFPMSSSQDEVSLGFARRVVAAIEAGDRDEAVRLTGELERALRRGTGAPAGGAPAFTAQPDFTAPALTARPDFAAEPAVVPVAQAPAPASSARQVITGALAEIGVACRARIVADYAGARFGQRVEPRMLAALRRDERRAWEKSTARPTYVVPALEGRYFQPVRGLLTLSDWPLERRLLGPWSERADHLAATAQLARQLAWLSERDAAVAERLAPVVAEMAASIPGALDGAGVDTARVASAAEAELAPLKERDEPWRQEAAARARGQLQPGQQLWGTTIGVVAEGEG
jgi:hypothetical protein